MRSATRLLLCLLTVALLFGLSAPVVADWDPGDGHKMHYPQLPDPLGWDVRISGPPYVVADDWQCSETGPVSAVHLWYSWRWDQEINIDSVHLSIHTDIPDPDGPAGPEYSMPGERLWFHDFLPGTFTTRLANDDQNTRQGWYDPLEPVIEPDNHYQFWQLNVVDIPDPFIQEEGTIYWLDVSVDVSDPSGVEGFMGWKTSLDHWNDDAVYWDPLLNQGLGGWAELRDPLEPEISLDMAFVIVPEPGSCILMGFGLLGMFVIYRRTRK